MIGVSAKGSSRTLIEVSRLAVITLVGASACASRQSIVLDAASLPAAVEEYEARGETVVENAISKQHMRVTRESEPQLTIVPRLEEHELGERFECAGSELSSPLERTRGDASGLTIDECHLDVDEIEKATLTFEPNEPVDVDDLPNRIGLQLGGSAYFQVAYRYRLEGPLFFDLGFHAQPHVANGSTGLVVQVPIADRWAMYLGVGGGFGSVHGDIDEPGCDPETTDCPTVHASTTTLFIYFRLGLALALGRNRRDILGVDLGAWEGRIREEEGDAAHSRRLLWPMAGFSYHYAF